MGWFTKAEEEKDDVSYCRKCLVYFKPYYFYDGKSGWARNTNSRERLRCPGCVKEYDNLQVVLEWAKANWKRLEKQIEKEGSN